MVLQLRFIVPCGNQVGERHGIIGQEDVFTLGAVRMAGGTALGIGLGTGSHCGRPGHKRDPLKRAIRVAGLKLLLDFGGSLSLEGAWDRHQLEPY